MFILFVSHFQLFQLIMCKTQAIATFVELITTWPQRQNGDMKLSIFNEEAFGGRDPTFGSIGQLSLPTCGSSCLELAVSLVLIFERDTFWSAGYVYALSLASSPFKVALRYCSLLWQGSWICKTVVELSKRPAWEKSLTMKATNISQVMAFKV